jgi:hypothetical protein
LRAAAVIEFVFQRLVVGGLSEGLLVFGGHVGLPYIRFR